MGGFSCFLLRKTYIHTKYVIACTSSTLNRNSGLQSRGITSETGAGGGFIAAACWQHRFSRVACALPPSPSVVYLPSCARGLCSCCTPVHSRNGAVRRNMAYLSCLGGTMMLIVERLLNLLHTA